MSDGIDSEPINQARHQSNMTESQGDIDGDPEPAPQGLIRTETKSKQVHLQREEAETGVEVDQPADPGKKIQNAQHGILETDDGLSASSLSSIGGSYVYSRGSSTCSSEYVFAAENWTSSTSGSPVSLQSESVVDETEGDEGSRTTVASEYSQLPSEIAHLSCQEYARKFQRVRSEFRIPEGVRQELQFLQLNPREEEIDIPVISLNSLTVDERPSVEDQFSVKCRVSEACKEWGVFQVRDHGIPSSLLEKTLDAARRFFDLPMADKMVYSARHTDDDSGYGGWESTVCRMWGDQLVHVLHLEKSLQENKLPTKPPRYGEFVFRYAKLVMMMTIQLIDACAHVQGVDVARLETILRDEYLKIIAKSYGSSFGDMISSFTNAAGSTSGASEAAAKIVSATALRINYHPPCPQPLLVMGREPCHARTAFEVVLQNQVPGLQILQSGRWRTLKYIPNTLVVFVGRALEIATREMVVPYKAVQYRVVADRENARISVTTAVGLHVTSPFCLQ